MFTETFRDRTSSQAALRLRQLLDSKALRPHRFVSACEIGPFVVEYVCPESSLIVELELTGRHADRARSRAEFLQAMGYTVMHIPGRELMKSPKRVLQRISLALG